MFLLALAPVLAIAQTPALSPQQLKMLDQYASSLRSVGQEVAVDRAHGQLLFGTGFEMVQVRVNNWQSEAGRSKPPEYLCLSRTYHLDHYLPKDTFRLAGFPNDFFVSVSLGGDLWIRRSVAADPKSLAKDLEAFRQEGISIEKRFLQGYKWTLSGDRLPYCGPSDDTVVPYVTPDDLPYLASRWGWKPGGSGDSRVEVEGVEMLAAWLKGNFIRICIVDGSGVQGMPKLPDTDVSRSEGKIVFGRQSYYMTGITLSAFRWEMESFAQQVNSLRSISCHAAPVKSLRERRQLREGTRR
jgi:hypothetical protein